MFDRVLVAGVGALGSEVVKNLGLLDCRSVFLVDHDRIEEKNVGRSVLLRGRAATGKSKVLHALERLREWFPETVWEGEPVEIADLDSKLFASADILFSCVDTDLARTEISALAARHHLPVCDAGLGGLSTRVGRVSWFPASSSSACFCCLLTGKRRAALLSLGESHVHACWAGGSVSETSWTSTPTMASMVAALQVETALSSVERGDDEAFSIRLDLDNTPLSTTILHSLSSSCPLHDDVPQVLFPLCTLAECTGCGTKFSPDRRIGWVRRWSTCPSCGSHDLHIRESSDTQTRECLS
jgi:molybdopterin-synthase adenylyltransferase